MALLGCSRAMGARGEPLITIADANGFPGEFCLTQSVASWPSRVAQRPSVRAVLARELPAGCPGVALVSNGLGTTPVRSRSRPARLA